MAALSGLALGAEPGVAAGKTVTKPWRTIVEESGSADPVFTIATSDFRVGVCADLGTFHRTYASGGADASDSHFTEKGGWLSYTRSLSHTLPQWRWEIYLTKLQASINSERMEGRLDTILGGAAFGYAPQVLMTGDARLQCEIMPFIGVGRADYRSTSQDLIGGRTYDTTVDASGGAVEYGLKANLIWIFPSGFEMALQFGLVQKNTKLSGDTSSNTGQTILSGDFTAEDVLLGLRSGLFVGYRF